MVLIITYYVHGTTTDNELHIATGWLDGELSPTGWRQVHELASLVQPDQYDLVVTSDLRRAVDTANVAFDGAEILKDRRLREVNYGSWNGMPTNSFKGNIKEYIDQPFPDGESYRQVEQRMRALCADLASKYRGGHIAFVGHQAPQLALEVITNNKSWPEAIDTDWRHTMSYQPGWEYVFRPKDA